MKKTIFLMFMALVLSSCSVKNEPVQLAPILAGYSDLQDEYAYLDQVFRKNNAFTSEEAVKLANAQGLILELIKEVRSQALGGELPGETVKVLLPIITSRFEVLREGLSEHIGRGLYDDDPGFVFTYKFTVRETELLLSRCNRQLALAEADGWDAADLGQLNMVMDQLFDALGPIAELGFELI